MQKENIISVLIEAFFEIPGLFMYNLEVTQNNIYFRVR